MNEEQINFLRGLGYEVKGGNIYKGGSFLPSVSINNQTYNSFLTDEEHSVKTREEEELKKKGFIYDPKLGQSEYEQKLKFKAQSELKKFANNPSQNPPPDKTNPYLTNVYDQYKKSNPFIREGDYQSYENNKLAYSDDPIIAMADLSNRMAGKEIVNLNNLATVVGKFRQFKKENPTYKDMIDEEYQKNLEEIESNYEWDFTKGLYSLGQSVWHSIQSGQVSNMDGFGQLKRDETGKIVPNPDAPEMFMSREQRKEAGFFDSSINPEYEKQKKVKEEEYQRLLKEYKEAAKIPLTMLKTSMELERDKVGKALNLKSPWILAPMLAPISLGMSAVLPPILMGMGLDGVAMGSDDETEAYKFAYNLYDEEASRLEDFLKDRNMYVPDDQDVISGMSMGWMDYINYRKNIHRINKKIDKEGSDSLTPAEMEVIKASTYINASQGTGYLSDMPATYTMSEGFMDSMFYLMGTAPGRMAGNVFTNAMAKNLPKAFSANLFGRALSKTVNYGTQGLLHSNTYMTSIQNRTGNMEMKENPDGTVTFLSGKDVYNEAVNEAKITIDEIDKTISKLESEGGDSDQIKALIYKKKQVEDNLKNLQPKSLGKSFVNGMWSTMEENIIEDWGGKLAPWKITKKFGKGLNKNIIPSLNPKTEFGQLISRGPEGLNRAFQKVIGGGENAPQMIGSLGEEMWEEVLVNLLPNYGQSWMTDLKQLTEGQFYTQVAGQTMMMMLGMGGTQRLGTRIFDQDYYKRRKQINDAFKEMQSSDLGEKKLEEILMLGGLGEFSMQQYNNKIIELRAKGDPQSLRDANEHEQNKFYEIALNAARYGKLHQFDLAVEKAKVNPNLKNKNILTNLLTVQEEMRTMKGELGEVHQYLNADDVLLFQHKKRYNERSLKTFKQKLTELDVRNDLTPDEIEMKLGLEKEITNLEANTISLDKIIKDLTSYSTQLDIRFKKNIEDKIRYNVNKYGEISDSQMSKVKAELVSKEKSRLSKEKVEKVVDDAINKIRAEKLVAKVKDNYVKTQQANNNVQTEQKSTPVTETINKDNALKQDIDNVLDNSNNSRGDDYLKGQVPYESESNPDTQNVDKMWREEASNAVENVATDIEDNPDSEAAKQAKVHTTIKEDNVVRTEIPSTETKKATRSKKVTKGIKKRLLQIEDSFNEDELANLSGSIRRMADNYKESTGSNMTFRDFINHIMKSDRVKGNKQKIRDHFASFGVAWERAGLGKSNWKDMFLDLYSSINSDIEQVLDSAKVGNPESFDQTDKTEKEVKKQRSRQEKKDAKNSAETSVDTDPVTGAPVKKTSHHVQILGLRIKVNYAFIDFLETPMKTAKGTFMRWTKDLIPKVRNFSYIDPRNLLNPKMNNINDKLKTKIVNQYEGTENEWEKIPIIVRNKNGTPDTRVGAKKDGVISFQQWVDENQPINMSLEQFMQTDIFKQKVPIVYVDAMGTNVGFVPETDWFNPVNVRDPQVENKEESNLDDLTPSHKNAIDEQRKNSVNMRELILSGKVSEVTIIDKSLVSYETIPEDDGKGNPILPKSLEEVAGDSILVRIKGDTVIDLITGKTIPKEQIIMHEEILGHKEGQMIEKHGTPTPKFPKHGRTMSLRPVQMRDGKMMYFPTDVLAKDENNDNKATNEDIETARWLWVANAVLNFPDSEFLDSDNPFHMTEAQAKSIHSQVMEITGKTGKPLNIRNFGELNQLINSMLVYQAKRELPAKFTWKGQEIDLFKNYDAETEQGDYVYKIGDHYVLKQDTLSPEQVNFADQLVKKGTTAANSMKVTSNFILSELRDIGIYNFLTSDPSAFIQNTHYKFENRGVPKVKPDPKTGSFKTEAVAETYDKFLKKRLSTNIMGFNVGTKEKPVFATMVQPSIIVSTGNIEAELEDKVEESKKDPKIQESMDKQVEKTNVNKKLSEKEKQAIEKKLKDATAFAKTLGIPDRKLGTNQDDKIVKQLLNPEMESAQKIADATQVAPGLTVTDERHVTGKILAWLSEKNITEKKVLEKFRKKYQKVIKEVNKHIGELRNISQQSVENHDRIKLMIQEMKKVSDKAEAILGAEKKLLNKALKQARQQKFITDEFDSEVEENTKEYWKTVAEEIPIDKVGVALRRIFARIPSGKTGVAGTEIHDSFKYMYDTVMAILATDCTLEANFNQMASLLREYDGAYPWITPLLEELEGAGNQLKSQFVTNFYKEAVKAKFIAIIEQGTSVITEIWSGNANNIKRNIKERWRMGFKRGILSDGTTYDKDEMKKLYDEWNSFGGYAARQSDKVIRDWLAKFGITVSDKTWEAMKTEKLLIKENRKWKSIKYDDLLNAETSFSNKIDPDTKKEKPKEEWNNKAGTVFAYLRGFLYQFKDSENPVQLSEIHPFDDMNNILEALARLEAKYNPTYISSVRYVNKKTLSEVEPRNYFYSRIKELKSAAAAIGKQERLWSDKETEFEDTLIDNLLGLSFSQDSYLLQLLRDNPEFAEEFEAAVVDKLAMKHLWKKNPITSEVDELSDIDYMFHQRALFQDTRQPKVVGARRTFRFRIATMSTPTNSDKGRMMLTRTAVFDFMGQANEAFFEDENGGIHFTDDLKELLYEQLVLPELRRSLKHKEVTDIDQYDKAANRFNFIPGFNTIKGKTGKTTIDEIGPESNHTVETFKEEFFESITNYIEEMALKEVNENLDTLAPLVEETKNAKHDLLNNTKYLNSGDSRTKKHSFETKRILAELDYTLNAWMHQTSIFQAVIGDPALYYAYKPKGNEVEGETLMSDDYNTQKNISIQLANNMGKRMAAMIAPGSTLNNSDQNKYLQVCLEDVNRMTNTVKSTVKWAYGEKSLQEIVKLNTKGKTEWTYEELLDEILKIPNLLDIKKKSDEDLMLKALEERFPDVKKYFNVESTNAQEYTTIREHIWVLKNYGRLSDETVDELEEALERYEETGVFDLPKHLRKVILQPMKPVYSGTTIDTAQDTMRMVYVKSSSFPLIPGLTAGTELDALRLKMEDLERSSGMTVRAAHLSAMKVGTLTKNFRVDPSKSASVAMLSEQNALVLDRKNFRIQQDTPYKSSQVQDDTQTMGSQIFKLLFGDDVPELTKFNIDGKEITLAELREEFMNTFSSMVGIKKSQLLNRLHLDENMKSKDKKKSAKALQELFMEEAEARGFSQQDKDMLTMVEEIGEDGEPYYRFRYPIWFSGNSNKLEAMFNAIINNKIFKQKLPGMSFIAGSGRGFRLSEDMADIDQNEIITIGGYNLGDLKSTREEVVDENGVKKTVIGKAQILVPSKFKLNGVLIDLFEGYDANTGEGKYIHKVDGILKLKEDMIDESLLKQFAFRIPTSSHALAASVEVVGFLPQNSGDLIIGPDGFIVQMGQDFDIDKLNNYIYHHLVFDDGGIHKLTEETKDAYIKQEEEKISAAKQKIVALRKQGRESLLGITDPEVLRVFEQILQEDAELAGSMSISELESRIEQSKKNIRQNFELKLAENRFIDIHHAIYEHPEMQKRINKQMSTTSAEEQADMIEEINKKDDRYFNILSPNYQAKKMDSGSTGQDAIGIYAKSLTFHSLCRQSMKPLQILHEITVEGEKYLVPINVQIGNIVSDGTLGMLKSLSKNNTKGNNKAVANDFELFLARHISDALDERAQISVDNEKLQVLGKVGLNMKEAIAVDNLMIALGIDKEINEIDEKDYDKSNKAHKSIIYNGKRRYYEEYSIPFLLHSQPIIQKYLKTLEEKRSITTAFSPSGSDQVATEMVQKTLGEDYLFQNGRLRVKTTTEEGQETEPVKLQRYKFTAKRLIQQMEDPGGDSMSEAQILSIYLDLINQSKRLRKANAIVDLRNLGKSMWEADTVVDNFVSAMAYGEAELLVSNVEGLMGQLIDLREYPEETPEQIEEKDRIRKHHEENVKSMPLMYDVYFQASTPQGMMVGSAISLSENLFTDYFAAKDPYINRVVNQIIDARGIDRNNDIELVEAKEYIFQEIKKYITSDVANGIFNENADEVRQDLYMDYPGHDSLSVYLGTQMDKRTEKEEYLDGIELLHNNDLLRVMQCDMGEGGKPSLIKYNTTEVRDYTVEHMHEAFRELFIEDLPLPPRNGQPYSTRKLAQELVSYSYAGGGIIKGPIQFHSFIPLEYYDEIMTQDADGNPISVAKMLSSWDTLVTDWEEPDAKDRKRLDHFKKQYFQNNPEHAKQFSEEFRKDNFIWEKGRGSFISETELYVDFVAVRNTKTKSKLKANKWRLYQRVEENMYVRIDVLGDTGMSEYEYHNPDLKSVIVVQTSDKILPQTSGIKTSGISSRGQNQKPLLINENDKPSEIFTRIINDDSIADKGLKIMAEEFIAMEPDNFSIEFQKFENSDELAEAEMNRNSNIMRISKEAVTNERKRTEVARAFTHEFIHIVAVRELAKWIESKFETDFLNRRVAAKPKEGLGNTVPKEVTDVMMTYNHFLDQLESDVRYMSYGAFKEEYTKFIYNDRNGLKKEDKDYKPYSFERFRNEGTMSLYYASIDIHEFIATVLANNGSVLKKLKDIKYRKTDKTLLDKIAEAIAKLIKYIKEGGFQNTFSEQAIVDSITFIKSIDKSASEDFENFEDPDDTPFVLDLEDSTERVTLNPESNKALAEKILKEDREQRLEDEHIVKQVWQMTDDYTIEYIQEIIDKKPVVFGGKQSITDFAKANDLVEIQGKYKRRRKKEAYDFVFSEADKRGIKLNPEFTLPSKSVIAYSSTKVGVVNFYDNTTDTINLTENFEELDPLKRSTALAQASLHGIVNNQLTKLSEQEFNALNDRLSDFMTDIQNISYLRDLAVVKEVFERVAEKGPQELIAYAFANEEFAAALNSVKIPGESIEKRSFWQQLKELILSVISDDKTMMDEFAEIMDEHLGIPIQPSIATNLITLTDIDNLPKCL